MKLARIFQDGIVLQRNRKICVWGEAESDRHIITKLNGEIISDEQVRKGDFTILLPAQKEQMDATMEIGDVVLHHVDIGEVWIASGQSNMEFELDYDAEGTEIIKHANDNHFRMYTVGRYSYPGQREKGYKAWNPWDEWKSFTSENAGRFSAVAVYFALQLRKKDIPVGIINVSWGGTSAAAWLDEDILKKDQDLKVYVDDYENGLKKVDLDQFLPAKEQIRQMMSSKESKAATDLMMKNTLMPEELMALAGGDKESDAGATIEYLLTYGPGDENVPGTLYQNMLSEVVGICAQGVLWYQGESDEHHANLYDKLFAKMIQCWRDSWNEKNPDMTKLPFLFVQLAPFGTWNGSGADNYPVLREAQEKTAKSMSDVWMISISDIGNVFDIHPKFKKQVGRRLYGLAEKYVYHEESLVEAPEAADMCVSEGKITISFAYAEGLHIVPHDFTSYNGFVIEKIPQELLPPILSGVNGLKVTVDESDLRDQEITVHVKEESLEITSSRIHKDSQVRICFAKTPFYQVNLYNVAEIPTKPFAF